MLPPAATGLSPAGRTTVVAPDTASTEDFALDGIVNGLGVAARKFGTVLYRYVDQGVVDGAVNGTGLVSEESGQFLRRLQTGKVQQYGALLFGAAVILAAIFVLTNAINA